MKHTLKSVRTLAATLITLGSLAGAANAAIIISNLSATSSTVTFTIAGTIDGPAPAANPNFLFLSSSIDGTDFLSDDAYTPSISGSAVVGGVPLFKFFMEDGVASDRITFGGADFLAGNSVSGTLTFTTTSNIINPTALLNDGVSIHWGRTTGVEGTSTHTGTFQGTTSIPEPSSILLLGLGAMGLVARRRRIK